MRTPPGITSLGLFRDIPSFYYTLSLETKREILIKEIGYNSYGYISLVVWLEVVIVLGVGNGGAVQLFLLIGPRSDHSDNKIGSFPVWREFSILSGLIIATF